MTDILIDSRLDPKIIARNLYWQGWRISSIGRHIGIKAATIYSWKERGNWDGGTPAQRVSASTEARLIQLINLPKKSDGDYKEIRQLTQMLDSFSKSKNKASEPLGKSMPDVPDIDHPPREQKDSGQTETKSKKTPKNYFQPEQLKRVQEIFHEQLFDYQRVWLEAGKKQRFRNIMKSRQIGATWFFARESLIKALVTGKNQIFLSASRAQAYQFKQYIQQLAECVDVELKGDVIHLGNSGADLHFLGTNSKTAQGRHGDVKVDEYFWIDDFTKLSNLVEPMAAQKQYTTTFFSTPSFKSHQAYPFWTGNDYNEGRPKSDHINLDVSHSALKYGRLDPDAQWRQIVSLDDAEAGGCNLFDRDYLNKRYSPDMFKMLFQCEFGSGGDTVFDYALLKKCAVDSWDDWSDLFKPLAIKPVGNRPVWIGYDPTDTGDAAGLIVALPPQFNGDVFRIIEKRLLYGNDFKEQADVIRKLFDIYNVDKLIIDSSGIGSAVFQLIEPFFPRAIGLKYTAELKALMVHKTMDLFRHGRVQWDAGDKDMPVSFLGIRRQMTSSGRAVTYVADRSASAGHCDLAWAAMMLFYQEPLDGDINSTNSDLEIS